MNKPLPKIELLDFTILPVFDWLWSASGILPHAIMRGNLDGKPFAAQVVQVLGIRGVLIQNAPKALIEDDWLRAQVEHHLMGIFLRRLDPKRYADHVLSGVKTQTEQKEAASNEATDEDAFD